MLPARRVTGMVSGTAPFRNPIFELLDSHENQISTRVSFSTLGGRFQLLDVPPGGWLLRVTEGEGNKKTYGEAIVVVENEDVNNLQVPLEAGVNAEVTLRCETQLQERIALCGHFSLIAPGGVAIPLPRGTSGNLRPAEYDFALTVFRGYVTSVRANGHEIRPGEKIAEYGRDGSH